MGIEGEEMFDDWRDRAINQMALAEEVLEFGLEQLMAQNPNDPLAKLWHCVKQSRRAAGFPETQKP